MTEFALQHPFYLFMIVFVICTVVETAIKRFTSRS
jgi:hypothetical protein